MAKGHRGPSARALLAASPHRSPPSFARVRQPTPNDAALLEDEDEDEEYVLHQRRAAHQKLDRRARLLLTQLDAYRALLDELRRGFHAHTSGLSVDELEAERNQLAAQVAALERERDSLARKAAEQAAELHRLAAALARAGREPLSPFAAVRTP